MDSEQVAQLLTRVNQQNEYIKTRINFIARKLKEIEAAEEILRKQQVYRNIARALNSLKDQQDGLQKQLQEAHNSLIVCTDNELLH